MKERLRLSRRDADDRTRLNGARIFDDAIAWFGK
jgi:hypothetical protein